MLDGLEQEELWEEWYQSMVKIYKATYSLGELYVKAVSTFDEKEHLISHLPISDKARYLRIHAYILEKSGKIRRSIEKQTTAVKFLKEIGDRKSLVSSYFNLSIFHSQLNDHKLAIKYASELLEFWTRMIRKCVQEH